ncbi:hypothetical protein ANN_16429 [Periplaneta americana]|uniref:Uncharacterized protein n=1 Tax=Periplaneta americana TaxID=6978 RepID=A0ABQ8SIY4_PERAM|nr:hypothetical protein ANN_16429 [Periplaneta americana]
MELSEIREHNRNSPKIHVCMINLRCMSAYLTSPIHLSVSRAKSVFKNTHNVSSEDEGAMSLETEQLIEVKRIILLILSCVEYNFTIAETLDPSDSETRYITQTLANAEKHKYFVSPDMRQYARSEDERPFSKENDYLRRAESICIKLKEGNEIFRQRIQVPTGIIDKAETKSEISGY